MINANLKMTLKKIIIHFRRNDYTFYFVNSMINLGELCGKKKL